MQTTTSQSRSRRSIRRALALAVLLCGASTARGAEVLKVATLAPQGSIWDTTLREMGGKWSKETAARVELRLYPGGVAGDEVDVVRKMRIGQFQGAALTVTGLAEIEPAFRVFHVPMLLDSWAELDYVLGKLRPELERRLAEKGYVLLLWGHGGWVHLFSRAPIRTVEDLKRQKMFVWAGDDAGVQQWRKQGFQPVPLAGTDVLMGLQTKMIDVVPTTPIAALSLQWYRQTPSMLGLGFAPLVGGVVVSKGAWEKVPAADRERLAAAIATAAETFAREVPKQDQSAIDQMKTKGLTVAEIGDADRAAWRKAADELAAGAREGQVPPEIFEAARAAIAEFRAGRGGAR